MGKTVKPGRTNQIDLPRNDSRLLMGLVFVPVIGVREMSPERTSGFNYYRPGPGGTIRPHHTTEPLRESNSVSRRVERPENSGILRLADGLPSRRQTGSRPAYE